MGEEPDKTTIPDAVKPELDDPDQPDEIGGSMGEPRGVWRILRNSVLLAVVALAAVWVVMQA